MNIVTIGVDIAKSVFQVHGVDAQGKAVLRKRLTRGRFLDFMRSVPPFLVGIEACGSSNHWARRGLASGRRADSSAAHSRISAPSGVAHPRHPYSRWP